MGSATIRNFERADRQSADKFAERRLALAQAALQTLSELGYAKTSLREIAQNSAFSHGVLHYYFNDKIDLITCCVRTYKTQCITRYDEVLASSETAEQLVVGFLAAIAETVRSEGQLHRLWYDLRSQSLFEEAFRADVLDIDKSLEDMVMRIINRLAELSGVPQQLPASVLYALFDGLFQQCLLKHLSGDEGAIAAMQANMLIAVKTIVAVPAMKPSC